MKLFRHTLTPFVVVAAAAALVASACNESMSREGSTPPDSSITPPGTPPDSGPPVLPSGGCCPVTEFRGCSPGGTPLPGGGWAPSPALCDYTIAGWDGRPYGASTDEHGCTIIIEIPGCCGCADAGPPLPPPPEPDAGPPPSPCAGLGPAACFANFDCVATFDDACCSSCRPGEGCADCTDPTYEACVPLSASRCPMGSSTACGVTPSWGCGPAAPACDGTHVVDFDSCDRAGCVPGYPSGEGEPSIDSAVCVAITANSCTAFCEIDPGPCPTGTVHEADGTCFTGRCIPSFVCG